uniref:Nucleoprotein n=1 Tax=Hetplan gecko arenavirus TaxID=3141950 RepID=A0AAU7SS55_9VIRU
MAVPYEQIKDLFAKNGLTITGAEIELRSLMTKLQKATVWSAEEVNDHVRKGGSVQDMLECIDDVNSILLRLHDPPYVADRDQKPVTLDAGKMDMGILMEIKSDIDKMKEKTGGEPGKKKDDTGFLNLMASAMEKLNILFATGLVDQQLLKKGPRNNQILLKTALDHYNLHKQYQIAAKEFNITIKVTEKKDGTQLKKGEMVNKLQVDYLALLAIHAVRLNIEYDDLMTQLKRLALIVNKMPLTTTVMRNLLETGKYTILNAVEGELSMFDSPFRLSKQRLVTACSIITGCVSERMLNTNNTAEFINNLVLFKRHNKLEVKKDRTETSVYEYNLYKCLTTPEAISIIQNRTKVEKRGLDTVRIVIKSDPTADEVLALTSKLMDKDELKAMYGDCTKLMAYLDNEGKDMLRSYNSSLSFIIDIEGTADDACEVALTTRIENAGTVFNKTSVLHAVPKNAKAFQQGSKFCHGLTEASIKESPFLTKDVYKAFGKLFSDVCVTRTLHCHGSRDIVEFCGICGIKARIIDVDMPGWSERNKVQAYVDAIGKNYVCSKKKYHPGQIDLGQAASHKHLPHCAETDTLGISMWMTLGR